ncbi:MAG: hypothetical protein ACYCV4_06895 [Dermatophilaceae bacterium]
MPRARRCTPQVREGRLAKANQFVAVARDVADLADQAKDVADAYVTLLVHAGVAAADVICCARLGEYAHGVDHNDAIALLKTADAAAARHLETLLKMKTRVGYGHAPASQEDLKKAQRAGDALLKAARAV